jgi:hypothetical protein
MGGHHRIEFTFDGGVMTGKLICPPDGCCDEDYKEGYCPARDWFDNTSPEEIIKGKVTVPVSIEWGSAEDDGPTFCIDDLSADGDRFTAAVGAVAQLLWMECRGEREPRLLGSASDATQEEFRSAANRVVSEVRRIMLGTEGEAGGTSDPTTGVEGS